MEENKKEDIIVLKKNIKSGNWSILKKTGSTTSRIVLILYGAYIPFGIESYNNSDIVNVEIKDNSNYNYNTLVMLKKILSTFDYLKTTDKGSKYDIVDKEFFSFIKELDKDKDKYNIRLYIKYGAKVVLKNVIGDVPYSQLQHKRCNIEIEVGSLWTTDKKYGVNIYATLFTII